MKAPDFSLNPPVTINPDELCEHFAEELDIKVRVSILDWLDVDLSELDDIVAEDLAGEYVNSLPGNNELESFSVDFLPGGEADLTLTVTRTPDAEEVLDWMRMAW